MVVSRNSKTAKLIRHCVVCGKKLDIILYPNRTYIGGHFFGKLYVGKTKKAEYWECNDCYKNSAELDKP